MTFIMNTTHLLLRSCFAVFMVVLVLSRSSDAIGEEVTHRFLACGAKTYIVEADSRISWTYPHSTRDGYALEDGRMVLTLSKSSEYPGGAVVEIAADGSERLIWKGTQSKSTVRNPLRPTPS